MLGWAPEQGLEGERVGPEHKSQHLSERGEMEEKPFHNGPQWNSSCKEWKYRQKSGGFTYSRLAARDGMLFSRKFAKLFQKVSRFSPPFQICLQSWTKMVPGAFPVKKWSRKVQLVQKIHKETKLNVRPLFLHFPSNIQVESNWGSPYVSPPSWQICPLSGQTPTFVPPSPTPLLPWGEYKKKRIIIWHFNNRLYCVCLFKET